MFYCRSHLNFKLIIKTVIETFTRVPNNFTNYNNIVDQFEHWIWLYKTLLKHWMFLLCNVYIVFKKLPWESYCIRQNTQTLWCKRSKPKLHCEILKLMWTNILHTCTYGRQQLYRKVNWSGKGYPPAQVMTLHVITDWTIGTTASIVAWYSKIGIGIELY